MLLQLITTYFTMNYSKYYFAFPKKVVSPINHYKGQAPEI